MTESNKYQNNPRTKSCGDCGGTGRSLDTGVYGNSPPAFIHAGMAAPHTKCTLCGGSGRLPLSTRRHASAGHLVDGVALVEK